jgi:hypothetical protein
MSASEPNPQLDPQDERALLDQNFIALAFAVIMLAVGGFGLIAPY